MKLHGHSSQSGFSLLLVIFLTGLAFFILSGVLRWNSMNTSLTDRHNEYYSALAAAEAATEKVISHISRDFQAGGYATVEANLAYDRSLVPTAAEAADWADYEFSDPTGSSGRTYVERIEDLGFNALRWKYPGFYGDAATYRIVSNARNAASGNGPVGAVKQDLQIASVPLFEFTVFYAMDLEITIGVQDLAVGGRVHCNTNIYCEPDGRELTFDGAVTSAHQILHQAHPADPQNRAPGTVAYGADRDWNVSSLNLPIGTTNTPEQLHQIIELPPPGEPVNSLLGQERFYNKADLVILISNTDTNATSKWRFGPIDWSVLSPFVSTTNVMWDEREGKTTYLTQIDVGLLQAYYAAVQTAIIDHDPAIIYVADLRTFPSATESSAVRLVNAQTLPEAGLTIATKNPLYVLGHFNAPTPGSTNTALARPASLVCDGITVLSGNWDDSISSLTTDNRSPAQDTTINAAIISGIVPTGGGQQSGSLENLLRLLQNWSSRTLTFNGSMAVLYRSESANGPYRAGPSVYRPPAVRQLGFDENFKTRSKLPPGTPQLRTVIRANWSATQPNSTL